MISLEKVEKVYRTEKIETLALSEINLHIEKGEFVSIMGPSGSGKSTLLNIIGLLDAPTNGDVEIQGKAVGKWHDRPLAKLRNEHIGFIFQQFHLVRDLKVIDNVEIPLLYRNMSGAERKKRCLEALEQVGLSARVNHRPGQLSGGQQQRVAIARAIVGSPSIILADEPTGNLDSIMGSEIMRILLNLNKENNATIIMVTHDPDLAEKTDRTIRLFDGHQLN